MLSHNNWKAPVSLFLGLLLLLLFACFYIISTKDVYRFVPKSFKTETVIRRLPLQTSRHFFVYESKPNSVNSSVPRIANATVTSNVFLDRLRNIDYYCDRRSRERSYRLRKTVRRDVIFIDDVHKLAYCMIPKSASTNWRRTLLALIMAQKGGENRTAEEILPTLNWNSCDKADREGALTTYRNRVHVRKNLKDYFLFTFVRHPFERILSAYRNKLAPDAPSGNKYFKKYATSMSPERNSATFTFKQFVNYLANHERESKKFELHWAKIVDLCNPCPIRYQFIGKTENLKQESEYLLQKLGLDRVSFPDDDKAKSQTLMSKYYAEIDESTLKRLYKVYEDDFLVYNFSYYHPGKIQTSDTNERS